jgi:uncharacterized protein
VTSNLTSPVAPPLAPIAGTERIAALDVVRGFALIGILLMNIEYFNRATADIGSGIAPGLAGANYWFSMFVQYFVTGKFWTMFSLLFGMGFGVMLMRAETAQRAFLVPYLRRIAALATFGALHHIFLWSGDILFSYAVAAVALLIVLYGRPLYILGSIIALVAIGFIPGMDWTYGIAGGIAYFAFAAWFLRCPERIRIFKFHNVPIFKIVVGFIIVAAIAAILVGLLVPAVPREGKFGLTITGSAFLILGLLMARFHNPVDARPWRMGVGLYAFSFVMMSAMTGAQYFYPDPEDALVRAASQSASAQAAAAKALALPEGAKPAEVKRDDKKKPTDAERIAQRGEQRAVRLAERKAKREREIQVLSKGTWAEGVAMRTKHFIDRAPGEVGFATVLIAMFLLGLWFVRSGIMANTKAHLPLFRKLALFALPLGIGLGLAGSLVATHAIPGTPNGYQFAHGLLALGNLPACLGYVAVIVLMLNSRMFSGIKVLAPFGRMALTNYLTHSLVFSTVFYAYGFGLFGIERVWQLACVVAIVLVQVPLCHLWLSHFRYGPVEWLWRAITYWQIPAMRITAADQARALPHPA